MNHSGVFSRVQAAGDGQVPGSSWGWGGGGGCGVHVVGRSVPRVVCWVEARFCKAGELSQKEKELYPVGSSLTFYRASESPRGQLCAGHRAHTSSAGLARLGRGQGICMSDRQLGEPCAWGPGSPACSERDGTCRQHLDPILPLGKTKANCTTEFQCCLMVFMPSSHRIQI